MQPPIWLLDEPTTGLDARLTGLLMERLHGLHRTGHTILLITHDLKLAAATQRMVGISQGRVALDGPPQSAMADSATLESIGLRPPPIARLSALLAEAGFPHPLLRLEQFVETWRLMQSNQQHARIE
jgi:energy-coupling factor transport system ATP-binding protein